MRILLVEDEESIRDAIRLNLELEGYEVVATGNGKKALEFIHSQHFDLLLLDVMLPDVDGFSITEQVRLTNNEVPILLLTAKDMAQDRVAGLKKGADDYLTKPFNPRELVARVRAILRRASPRPAAADEGAPIVIGNLSIYPERRLALVENRPVDLRMKEFDLLLALAQNPGVVFSREKLLDVVWGFDFAGETRTVDVHIAHLRHKLAGMQAGIETVWGVGYKLEMA